MPTTIASLRGKSVAVQITLTTCQTPRGNYLPHGQVKMRQKIPREGLPLGVKGGAATAKQRPFFRSASLKYQIQINVYIYIC